MTLFSFLGIAPANARGAVSHPSAPPAAAAVPAADPGLERQSVQQLLAPHADLLARLKLCYGTDRATFERDLLEPIRRYAAFVNALPATADNFFCECGGSLRLALEAGFFALQGTDGHIIAGRSTISTRRELEPRWRLATFLAGMCCELHRTLGQLVVTDERGEPWPAYLLPLTTWLEQQRSQRFFVRWLARAQESRALALFALPHVVPASTMQYLATGNSVVVPQMLACLGGGALYCGTNILAELVQRAAALVIDRDLVASAARYGRPILGAHLERYLVDAMRRLVASDASWTPNAERSRVWYGRDGLYVVWPNAAADIRRLLEDDRLPGIPKAPETILEILTAAGVVTRAAGERALWTISPPGGRTALESVKLSTPAVLLPAGAEVVRPLDVELAVDPGIHRQPATAAAASPAAPPAVSASALETASTPPSATAPQAMVPPAPYASVHEPTADALEGALHGTPKHAAPPQRELFEPAPQGQHEPAAHSAAAPAAPNFSLDAPLRLHPRVRDALSDAIASLNGDPKSASAVTTPAGVFIPLVVFKRAQLEIPVVLRALAEPGLVARSSSGAAQTVTHEFGGVCEIGVVLRPRFVRGLNPADFAPET